MPASPPPPRINRDAPVPAGAPRRLRRFAVRGPHCPRCCGPLAVGEGARLCAVCGYVETMGRTAA